MTFLVTGRVSRPCPFVGSDSTGGLYLIKAGGPHPRLLLMGLWMSLALLTLCLLCVRPAQAQGDGSWQMMASPDGTDILDELDP